MYKIFFAIQDCFHELIPFITKFQREKRCIFLNQVKENPISFPEIQAGNLVFWNPLQYAFVTIPDLPSKSVYRVKTDVFRILFITDKG